MATSLWCAAARRSSCCVQRDVPLKEVIAKTLACGSCPGILRPGTCSRTFSSLRRLPSSIRSTRYPKRAASLLQSQCRRNLETESAYHPVANEALDLIQDAVDDLLDSQTSIDYEVSLASGVLTIKLPPHGTWVINKQTPNLQLWWSSPLSGPKRFEYDDVDRLWFSTKDGLNLGHSLSQEIHHIYPELDPLDLTV